MKNTIATILLMHLFLAMQATTWNEPWHEDVLKESETFVLARVLSFHETEGINIEVLRSISGTKVKGTLTISEFFMLDLCSTSAGHGPEFYAEGIDSCFFFLRKVNGKWGIPTPSTGYAPVSQNNVAATYRHSYHQALVPMDLYISSMEALFLHAHGKKYDKKGIDGFIRNWLSRPPTGIFEETFATFFAQHVALECIYHLGLDGYGDLTLPFLEDSINVHNNISAARALGSSSDPDVPARLIAFIRDVRRDAFAQVCACRSLGKLKPVRYLPEIKALRDEASDAPNGFGGNIMDPRVCTGMPSVRAALDEVIALIG